MAETKKEKELRWLGSAREDLNNFPKEALKEAGYQLGKVQAGIEPDDWKPFMCYIASKRPAKQHRKKIKILPPSVIRLYASHSNSL